MSKFAISRREFLKLSAVLGGGLTLPWQFDLRTALASVQLPQTPLDPKTIPQFVEPVPVFGPAGPIPRVAGGAIAVSMEEIQQKVLPASFYAALPAPYNAGTYLWAYRVGGRPPLFPGVTVEAIRGTPTTMTYLNNLPVSGSIVQKYITIDQTIHWANPLGLEMMDPNRMEPYGGPPPTVAHMHGAEVQSIFDGGPDQWFTPGNGYKGRGFTGNAYTYPNGQQATTLWFHDHTLGATRTNVYAGLAAFYLLRDQYDTGLANNPLGLPAGAYEIELALQDRQFDTNGQWLFPDGAAAMGLNGPPPNPLIHPFWNPEFFGNVMVVNGKSWPYLEVEPRRYRFRLLNGCNARFLELWTTNKLTNNAGPTIWQIGSDGGLLDMPTPLSVPVLVKKNWVASNPRLVLAPGERADVIIDFGGYAGQSLVLNNTAKAPSPFGAAPDPKLDGDIMQFNVGTTVTGGTDTTYNPATLAPLRGGANQMPAIINIKTATPDVRRQLTLVEVMGLGGPVEALVNNTKWTGKRDDDTDSPIPDFDEDNLGNVQTELPKVGTTELWEIVNLTGDTHPIHLHLVQFQLVSRQAFNVNKYSKAYDAAFPGGTYGGVDMATGQWMPNMVYPAGVFIPTYGPPLPYLTPNADGAIGGNPAVGPYLQGPVKAPGANELGWKDTVQMNPGEVTRIMVRFTNQDGGPFPFDASAGPGYVWHCHIIDHEDNEMMRPYHPVP